MSANERCWRVEEITKENNENENSYRALVLGHGQNIIHMNNTSWKMGKNMALVSDADSTRETTPRFVLNPSVNRSVGFQEPKQLVQTGSRKFK
jgi:hypothetical protein